MFKQQNGKVVFVATRDGLAVVSTWRQDGEVLMVAGVGGGGGVEE